jgi:TRAP-type mannitol/chloroaromatic compound transport system permease small subunit
MADVASEEPHTAARRSAVDRLSAGAARLAALALLAMTGLSGFNALARYLDRDLGTAWSSNRWVEGQWYLFSAVFLLGAAETLRRGAHVRVDVLYARFPGRLRTWIDLLGALLLLLPFCAFSLWTLWPAVAESWRLREGSPDPRGLPRYPIKALALVGFGLLFLQGLAESARALRALRRRAG